MCVYGVRGGCWIKYRTCRFSSTASAPRLLKPYRLMVALAGEGREEGRKEGRGDGVVACELGRWMQMGGVAIHKQAIG